MSSESVGKKITELRVCDLKAELEKRGLETTGIKIALFDRLQKALTDANEDPNEYIFDNSAAKPKPKSIDANANGGDEDDVNLKEEKTEEINDESNVKDEPEKSENLDTIDIDADQEHLQLTVADSDKLDTSNVDNEDSLNLTIGEDEAKIFQDEETDEKIKENNNIKDNIGSDSSKISSGGCGDADGTDSTNNNANGVNGSQQNDNDADDDDDDDENDPANSAENLNDSSQKEDDGNGSTNGNKKLDESESKTSSSKSSKDDKDSTSKSASKTGSSSTASRNLWVSGLSSLTRATDLKIIFSKYGKVIGAKVVTNTRTPGTRCFGYVTMNSSADATKCISNLHRTELHGRIISVERAKSDIGNIGNKQKRTSASGDGKKPIDDDKKSTTSDRQKKTNPTKDDDIETTEKKLSAGIKTLATAQPKEKSIIDETKAESASEASMAKSRKSDSSQKDDSKKGSQSRSQSRKARARPIEAERRDRKRERDREAVLSYRKIREEHERQRLRERERKMREEERHRAEARRRQRDEEERLLRERERLKKERLRLEREKADLLRLERERQKLEREKIELERLELKRQQLKIEEAKRAMKRTSSDRYDDIDRSKRRNVETNERRFEPPPPPRFDATIRSSNYDRAPEKKRIDDYPNRLPNSSKRNDDYKSSSRGGSSTIGNSDVSSFKRPLNDVYPKRNDLDTSSRSTSGAGGGGGYEPRGGVSTLQTGKDHRFNDAVDNRGSGGGGGGGSTSFGRNRVDDRDVRGSISSSKSRYMDNHNNGSSNDRYSDRQSSSSSSSAWGNPNNGPQSSVKTFGSNNLNHLDTNEWGGIKQQVQENWNRSIDQNQSDRYDRTYNERSKYLDGPVNAGSGSSRPTSFIQSRPQERYNTISSRFDGGRF